MPTAKTLLRKRIKALKAAAFSSREDYLEASRALLARVEQHPRFISARVVAAFWSLPDEPYTHDFLERWYGRKTLLLPKVSGDDMEFVVYRGRESMRAGAFGILEPAGELFVGYETLDLVLVPGVAFDGAGHRLGRGRGYYDRFFASLPSPCRPYRLGLCFPFQLLDAVPCDPWDLPVDEVVAEHRQGLGELKIEN